MIPSVDASCQPPAVSAEGRGSRVPAMGGIVAAMTAELEVLEDAVTRLERAGVPYMLTGSIALSYYAQPRMTRDIDLVVELSKRDPKSLAALFTPDYYVAEADVTRALATSGMFNILHLGKLVKLDLIVRKDTAYRRHEFERRKRVPMPGFEAWIVSREDLILSKLAWGRDSGSEVQMRDVQALLASGADRQYLERWAKELSVEELLRKNLDAGHDI
jgi:hypothetical protein